MQFVAAGRSIFLQRNRALLHFGASQGGKKSTPCRDPNPCMPLSTATGPAASTARLYCLKSACRVTNSDSFYNLSILFHLSIFFNPLLAQIQVLRSSVFSHMRYCDATGPLPRHKSTHKNNPKPVLPTILAHMMPLYDKHDQTQAVMQLRMHTTTS